MLGTPTTVQALNYLEHTTLVTIDYWLYFFITLGIDEASERGRAIVLTAQTASECDYRSNKVSLLKLNGLIACVVYVVYSVIP